MSIEKIATIVNKLQLSTKKGSLQWEKTEKEAVYEVAFPNFTIRLSSQPTEEEVADIGDVDYVISIYDSSGTSVESASDIDLKPVLDQSYKILKEIYQSAKGYALGTEQTLDSIISTLDEDDIPF